MCVRARMACFCSVWRCSVYSLQQHVLSYNTTHALGVPATCSIIWRRSFASCKITTFNYNCQAASHTPFHGGDQGCPPASQEADGHCAAPPCDDHVPECAFAVRRFGALLACDADEWDDVAAGVGAHDELLQSALETGHCLSRTACLSCSSLSVVRFSQTLRNY